MVFVITKMTVPYNLTMASVPQAVVHPSDPFDLVAAMSRGVLKMRKQKHRGVSE